MAKQKTGAADCDSCATDTAHTHPDHSDQLKRLARIRGQVDGVARMIEEGRYCVDILTQTAAVRAALKSLETAILEKHMEHCVRDAMNGGGDSDQKIAELMAIFKKTA
jgi:CsoR family transcriptional regulator, copper-sensing transcriptional repressor